MSTPASKPEFSKGVVEPVGDCGMFEAAIDHLTTDNNVMTPHGPDTDASKPPQDWGGRILMYGKTAEQATALRERILVDLELCRGAEIEWLSGFNSNPYRLPVDQFIERAMGHSGTVEVEREYLRIIQAQDATHRKELGRLGAELSSYQDMLQDTSLEYGQKLRALEQRLAQAVDLLGQAQVFVEQGDDDSQAWMDLSSGISNLLAIASAPAIEPSRQVTDGGRNPRYEGLFDGETEEQRALRLAPATEAAKLCMGCVEQSSRIRELEHKMDYYRAASPAADFEALPFWKPCNPGCDPEFNGQRSKWCAKICHPAREALSASASASADGERAAFERVYASYARMTLAEVQALWDGDLYQDQGLRDAWYGWKARAAISAPSHSEQVREGWQLVPVEPTDAMLEAGDKYIGTPATYKSMLSACPSPAITKDFSQFLSAVMDAAGLIRHGRQSKELSEYLGMKCMEYRGAALSAPSHGEQVREWVPVSERLPETKAGTDADFVVAIRRAHNGKTYVVPASFLNRFELYSEDEAADDEGRIYVTGWYREMADDEYDTSWHKMETKGDVITHWQELPAAPSAGSQEQGE